MASTLHCDVAIVGAGLAGGLVALALKRRHPLLDVRLIDAARTIGGNHVWSFFGSDVDERDRWIVAPLISYGWRTYDIAFPAHRRQIDAAYYSIRWCARPCPPARCCSAARWPALPRPR
jgi:lycopene beta-cyclase